MAIQFRTSTPPMKQVRRHNARDVKPAQIVDQPKSNKQAVPAVKPNDQKTLKQTIEKTVESLPSFGPKDIKPYVPSYVPSKDVKKAFEELRERRLTPWVPKCY